MSDDRLSSEVYLPVGYVSAEKCDATGHSFGKLSLTPRSGRFRLSAVAFHTASAYGNEMAIRRNKKPRTRRGLMLHIDSCLDSALAPRQSYSN
jgi:hypothetical protein